MKVLKDNLVALIIGGLTLVIWYAATGYRLDALEKQQAVNTTAIAALRQVQQDENLQIQISLTQIKTDLEYLKAHAR